MNKEELKQICEIVKARFNEVKKDIKDFDFNLIDENKQFDEVMKIVEPLLPKTKQMIEAEERERESKEREETEIERIKNIPNGEEEEKIFNKMDNLIKQVIIDKKTRGLLLYGASSLGKTFRVRKAMAEHKTSYVLHSGHITE